MRILISGFEAFGGENVNPTAELVRDIAWLRTGAAGYEAHAVLLPVTFSEAYERLSLQVRALCPDVVIALGQGAGRAGLQLERVAVNCIDAPIPDNGGVRPVDQAIAVSGPAAYFSTLPLKAMVDGAQAAGVAASISNSAGLYVCNYVMYRLLADHRYSARRCGFIHVPLLPEQARDKTPEPPSMALADMQKGLGAMLSVLAAGSAG